MAYSRNTKTSGLNKKTLILIVVAIIVVAAALLIVLLKPGARGEDAVGDTVAETAVPTIGPDTSVVPATEMPISEDLLAELEAGETGEDAVNPLDGAEADYKTAFADPAAYKNYHVAFTGAVLRDSENNQGLMSMDVLVDDQYYVFVNYLDMSETLRFQAGDTVTISGIVLSEMAVNDADGNAQDGVMVSAESIE